MLDWGSRDAGFETWRHYVSAVEERTGPAHRRLDYHRDAPSYRRGGVRVLAFAAAAPLWTAAAVAKAGPDSLADLVENLVPAVVNISTTQTIKGQRPGVEIPQFPPGSPFEQFFKDFFDRQQKEQQTRKVTSLGSGFIIDPAGYIVTNNHVIADADEITVILQDAQNTSLKAKLVGRDTKTDLALLKVDAGHPLPAVKWGNSDKIRVGDWVVAIGNPFGLGGTVTAGIISARARELNSGGPMFNMACVVIDVNSAIFSPTGGSVGIVFAIPSSLAEPVIEQLLKYGHTRRGWLGVRIQTVTEDIAESMGLNKPSGALVASVTGGGPAEAAGIQPGDIILKFDGKDVMDMRHLPRIVAETEIGKSVDVQVWRKGKRVDLKAKVGELQETEEASAPAPEKQKGTAPGAEKKIEALGVSLAPISQELRDRYEIGPEVKGVVVTAVDDSGGASEKGIRPGDVFVTVSQDEVTTPADVAARVQKAAKAGQKSVLVLVERAGDLRFVVLRIGKG